MKSTSVRRSTCRIEASTVCEIAIQTSVISTKKSTDMKLFLMNGREIFCHQVSFFSSWVKGSVSRGEGAFSEVFEERGMYFDDDLADAGSSDEGSK